MAEIGGPLGHFVPEKDRLDKGRGWSSDALVVVIPDLSSPDLPNSIGEGVDRRAQEVGVDSRISDTALEERS